jgi:glycosyltransferase involved in cell wall biosynthesis
MERKVIVVSAVNFLDGGTFSVLLDCLAYLNDNLAAEYEIKALVHKKELVAQYKNVEAIEFPEIKSSWLKRIKFEYRECLQLSREWKPYLWLALHDMTPVVESEIQAVYCHNPTPFYKASIREGRYDRTFYIFTKVYKYLYRLYINRNTYVIVQQNWIRKRFEQFCTSPVVVAYPDIKIWHNEGAAQSLQDGIYRFFYPALPRVFKNFEVLFDAAVLLGEQQSLPFEMIVTFDGTENAYSAQLVEKYKKYPFIKFSGRQSRNEVMDLYAKVDALVFPSKLETWGLPITEMKTFDKPILLADLEYAYETVGTYDKVKFFDHNDPAQLFECMQSLLTKSIKFDGNNGLVPDRPFTRGWKELFLFLLNK